MNSPTCFSGKQTSSVPLAIPQVWKGFQNLATSVFWQAVCPCLYITSGLETDSVLQASVWSVQCCHMASVFTLGLYTAGSYGVGNQPESQQLLWGGSHPSWIWTFDSRFCVVAIAIVVFTFYSFAVIYERKSALLSAGHSPNAADCQIKAKLKSEAQNHMWDSHVGNRDPSVWAITCCFSGWALIGS